MDGRFINHPVSTSDLNIAILMPMELTFGQTSVTIISKGCRSAGLFLGSQSYAKIRQLLNNHAEQYVNVHQSSINPSGFPIPRGRSDCPTGTFSSSIRELSPLRLTEG